MCSGWGFASHRLIQARAIHTLPHPVHAFFKRHHAWIEAHSVDADRRKHLVIGEAEKHYMDLDRYGNGTDSLRWTFPRDWNEAVELYGDSLLRQNGTITWSTIHTYERLVDAFQSQNIQRILRQVVDLGHYISDLHVPLHTSQNYNGAMTGQHGIHALWETQLPEQFYTHYQLTPNASPNIQTARYILHIDEAIWNATFDSHQALDSVFKFEKQLMDSLGAERSFAYVERGRTNQRWHAPHFAAAYHRKLDGQVERRMQYAIQLCGDLWYSAWVDAGQPKLSLDSEKKTSTWFQKWWQWVSR